MDSVPSSAAAAAAATAAAWPAQPFFAVCQAIFSPCDECHISFTVMF